MTRTLSALIIALLAAAPTLAEKPADQDALARELMRKAQAHRNEEGLCARVDWPMYAPGQQDGDAVGTVRRYKMAAPHDWCMVTRTVAVTTDNGRRCVREERWGCLVRGSCLFQTAKFCRNEQGFYVYVRE